MRPIVWKSVLFLAACFAVEGARGQSVPQVGYVYPAGGQRGSTVDVVLGGQRLAGVHILHLSGEGVTGSVIKHVKPLAQQKLNELRQKLNALRKRLQPPRGRKETRSPQVLRGLERQSIRTLIEEYGLEVGETDTVAGLMKALFDPKKQLNPQLADRVLARIEIARDATPGPRDLRLVTPAGVTRPVPFHVGAWTEHREQEAVHDDGAVDRGLPDRLPVIINGQILPGDIDRFRFEARKGQRIVAAVSARGLIPYLADAVPGWFQAILAIRDSGGEEVAYRDDFRFDPDPALVFEAPADGTYELEIRDAVHRGREDFVYRVALGELPRVTGIFPLGGELNTKTRVAVEGWNLSEKTIEIDPGDAGSGVRSIVIGGGAAWRREVPFGLDTLPEQLEAEPNDAPQGAQPLKLPRLINGRIDRPGDRDVFRFEARSGDVIVAEVLARRLGSPLDSIIEVRDSGGRILAFNDDFEDRASGLVTHHADSALELTVPADGRYLLELRDTRDHGGRDHAYRLRVGPPRPDFELRILPSGLVLRPGDTRAFEVQAFRRDGFAGDIHLELEDAPPGFELAGGRIPGGRNRIRLTLSAPRDASTGIVPITLVGRAEMAGRTVRRVAVPADDWMQAFINHHLVPARDWVVAVGGRSRWSLVSGMPTAPLRLVPGETTRLRLRCRAGREPRRVRLHLAEPPAGIALQKVAFPDPDHVEIIIRARAGEVDPGLRGNLILNATIERAPQAGGSARTGGKAGQRKRRTPLGTLPAIPFEVVTAS